MWKNKTVDKIFKYFGFDTSGSFTNDEEKSDKRTSAIKKMEMYGKIPNEVFQKVITYDDNEIQREKRAAEAKRRERERLLNIRATKNSNRVNDSFSDDLPAKAVYQFLMDEQVLSYDENDIDSFKSEREELQLKLKKINTKLEKLNGSNNTSTKVTDMIDELEIKVDELESKIDELTDDIESEDIYETLYEDDWTHYGLRHFETDHGDYAVGIESEVESAAKENMESYLDELGLEGISSWVVTNNLDEDSLEKDLKQHYYEYYNDDVRYDLESWFSDYDEDDEETHPSEDDIEEKVDELVDDRVSELLDNLDEVWENGYSISDYVDMDGVADDIIQADGYGHVLSSYDGNENIVEIDGVDYYIFRTN